jgi:hypothetical protein
MMRRGLQLVEKSGPVKLSRAQIAAAAIGRIQGELEDLKKLLEGWGNPPPPVAA